MNKKCYIPLAVAALLLQGCVNIGASKQVIIPVQPSQKSVIVTSTATVHCRDFIIFYKCNLEVNSKVL